MFSTIKRHAATIALSIATASASVLSAAPVASAATPVLDQHSLPNTTAALGESTRESTKADLVVLFQKVEQSVNGYVWTYTVANAMPNPAQNVVVTKSFKIVQSGPPNGLAAPGTQNLGTLSGYEVREIKISCGNNTPQKQCVGTGLSAKTSTPEVIQTNNSASHSF